MASGRWNQTSERRRIKHGRIAGAVGAGLGAISGATSGIPLGPAGMAAGALVGGAATGLQYRAAYGIGSRIARNVGIAYQSSPRNSGGRSYGRGASNAAQV